MKRRLPDERLAAILFAALAAVFWHLRCRTFGPGDSGQHVLSALTWGVSRPPGYPLYTMLGWLWTRLPWAEPAAAVDGLSGACAAGAAALLFLALRRRGCGRPAALAASGMMAFSPLFWYYAEVAEVRALNDLLAVASAWLLFAWLDKGGRRRLLAFAAILGLGVSHHPTFALLLPAFAWALWPARGKAARSGGWGAAAAFAAGVVSPYALLWLRLRLGPAPAYNPDAVTGAAGVLALFLRRNTGGYFNMFAHARSMLHFDAGDFLLHAGWMVSAVTSGLGPAGLAACAIGIAVLWRKDRALLLFWELWFAATALVFLLLSSQQMPRVDPDYLRAVSLRFYLLPMIALFALGAHGLDWLLARARPALGWALAAAVWLGPLALGRLDLRGHDWSRLYGEAIIDDSGPRDFVVLASDDAIVATTYADVVEGRAGDRVFLLPWLFGYRAYVDGLARRHPGLTIPRAPGGAVSSDLRDWVKANPSRGLCAEAVDLEHLARDFGHAGLRGALAAALPKEQSPAERARQAAAFRRSPLGAADLREGYLDTQEVYLVKALASLERAYGLPPTRP